MAACSDLFVLRKMLTFKAFKKIQFLAEKLKTPR
jgi:hypothetical protein